MANGYIPMTTNNSDDGYCKMPDGTLICWGQVVFQPAEVGRQYVEVTVPVQFTTVPYTAVSWNDNINPLPNFMDGTVDVDTSRSSASKIVFTAIRTNANYAWIARFIAIGRWK